MKNEFFKGGLFNNPTLSRFETWMNRMIGFIKTKYNIPKVRVHFTKEQRCYTDGSVINIGTEFPLFSLVEDRLRPLLAQGIVLHEISHVLYSPFSILQMSRIYIRRGMFWPEKPSIPTMALEYAKKGTCESARVYSTYCMLVNILEDARIEFLAMTHLRQFGKFITGLKLVRKIQRDTAPSFWEIVEKCDTAEDEEKKQIKMQSMFGLILDFARFGSIKDAKASDYTHELLVDFAEISDYINDAVGAVDADTFFRNLNNVYASVFDKYILPYFESIDDSDESIEADGDGGATSTAVTKALSGISNGMPGKTEDTDLDSETSMATSEVKRELEKSSPSKSGSSKEEEGEKSESEEEESTGASGKENEEKSEGENEEDSGSLSAEEAPSEDETSSEEKGTPLSTDIGRKETSSIWSGCEGGTELTEKDIDTINSFNPVAIREVETAVGGPTRDYDAELAAPDIDYGHCHDGITMRINRVNNRLDTNYLESEYQKFDKYISAGQKAAKALKPYIQQENKAEWQRNRYYGSRFDVTKAANPNLRHFTKKTSKPKTPSLSVAILVDESGSMSGNKIEVARATAITLYEMCSALDINFAVFGHTTHERSDCVINNYCMFGEHAPDTKYKLLSISARYSNRDGAALRYVAEMLSKEQTDRKLLIIISDGQPAAMGYGGTAAEKDIKTVISDYKLKRVGIVSAAIDQDKDRIKGIYGEDRFLAIDDISTLPSEIVKIIRRVLFM